MDPSFSINPFIDLPNSKNYESETSIKMQSRGADECENDFEPKIRGKEDLDDNYFGYYSTSKCYRVIREAFLISTYPRIHRAAFRSYYGVIQERSRHLASFPWIIHPYSTFRWAWEILLTLALLVTLIRQPILISFMSESITEARELIISTVFSGLFLIDIVVNFRTGYVNQETDTIVLDPTLIARIYLKTWFIIDVLSTIPYDSVLLIIISVTDIDQEKLTFFQYVRLLELLKILRLSRVIRYFTRFQEAYVSNALYIRVINLHIVIFFALHWLSCMHYLVADMFNDNTDPKPGSWVTQLDLWNQSVFIKYINSVVRALSNMACLGYGNDVPKEPEDIICTIISIMIGATFFALFVGNLSSILINKDISQKKYAELLNQVMEYMRFKQIPKELQHRVIMYYEQRYRKNFFNESIILENISDVLRQELQMFNCRNLVEVVPLLQGLPQAVIQGIVSRLKFEVYLPQDILINAGTLADSMFFVEHGALTVLGPSGRAIAHLRDGDFFGEMALITDERRNSTVVATSFCDIYRLMRSDFDEVVLGYPEVYERLIKMAEVRAQKLTIEQSSQSAHKIRKWNK